MFFSLVYPAQFSQAISQARFYQLNPPKAGSLRDPSKNHLRSRVFPKSAGVFLAPGVKVFVSGASEAGDCWPRQHMLGDQLRLSISLPESCVGLLSDLSHSGLRKSILAHDPLKSGES